MPAPFVIASPLAADVAISLSNQTTQQRNAAVTEPNSCVPALSLRAKRGNLVVWRRFLLLPDCRVRLRRTRNDSFNESGYA